MPSRSERRRRRQRGADSGSQRESHLASLLRRADVTLAALLGVAVLVIVAGAIVLSGGDSSSSPGAEPAPTASGTIAPAFSPATADEVAIEALARRTIEALPQGQWPDLYDAFSAEFRQRCPRDQFVAAGAEDAKLQGANLPLIKYKRVVSASVTGTAATATIMGELAGQSEYTIQASFALEDGVWKIAPAPNTQGCEAFTRLTG